MRFTIYSDKGGRDVNDDHAGSAAANGIYCFAVADGMGSHGHTAAALVVSVILKAFEKAPEISSDALEKYISSAQKMLLKKKSEAPELDNAAAAVAVLVTNGKKAVWANSGDARVYVFRHGRISEVSEDHSAAFEEFLDGTIGYGNIRFSSGRHKLRRAVGDGISWEPDVSDAFSINSSFSFLLCTDGFWSLIREEEMEKAKMLSLSAKGWLGKMLDTAAARIKDGSDNLSAAAVCMQISDTV